MTGSLGRRCRIASASKIADAWLSDSDDAPPTVGIVTNLSQIDRPAQSAFLATDREDAALGEIGVEHGAFHTGQASVEAQATASEL